MSWKRLKGAANAPAGKVWISNGEGRFGGKYEHRLAEESCDGCRHFENVDFSGTFVCALHGEGWPDEGCDEWEQP